MNYIRITAKNKKKKEKGSNKMKTIHNNKVNINLILDLLIKYILKLDNIP